MDIRPVSNTAVPSQAPSQGGAPVASAAQAVVAPAPVETTNAVRQPAAVPSTEQVAQAVKDINKAMESLNQGIEFSLDEDVHRTVVKVIDQKTKEVLRQMPSEETLEIAKALDKLQGLLIKAEA